MLTCGGPDDGGAPKAPGGGALPNPGRCCEGGCCVGGAPKFGWGGLPVCCCPGIACKEGSESRAYTRGSSQPAAYFVVSIEKKTVYYL